MDLELNYRPSTGHVVTSDLFGGNALYTHNDVGSGTTFDAALHQIGIDGLRYPGGTMTEVWGEAFIRAPNTPPDVAEGEHTFVGLHDFLTYAQSEGQPVTIVLPTRHLFVGEAEGSGARDLRMGKVAEMADFVADMLRDYPDVDFAGFEIGNEYWNPAVWMTSEEYGKLANAVAIAVQDAMDDVLGEGADQPAILMQMGDVWGRDFDVGAYSGMDIEWWQKWTLANNDILDAMSGAARDAVDGLIGHYYYVETGAALTPGDTDMAAADRYFRELQFDYETFLRAWGLEEHGPLELAISEWGPEHRVSQQWGLAGASVMLEMFEGLLRLGADSAHVWPIEYAGPTDLAGRHDGGDGVDGDLLTPLGEVFRLMSEYATGLELLDNGFNAEDRAVESVEVNAFGSDERFVVFISSRSEDAQNLTLDVSAYVDAYSHFSGERIVQADPEAHWNEARWFATTEALSSSDLGGSTELSVSLGAYEVAVVEFVLADEITGARDSIEGEEFLGRSRPDHYVGSIGHDRILGRAGADRLMGNAGDDLMAGQRGNDRLAGQGGNDRIVGGAGNDRLLGHGGDDVLLGGRGRDVLIGHDGDDVLRGGDSRDVLVGGAGRNELFGGWGSDVFLFNSRGFSTIHDWEAGRDRINLRPLDLAMTDVAIFDESYVIKGVLQDGALVDFGQGAVFLVGVDVEDLSGSDFIF
ncbi:calcium-binding protein [Maritimibacter dapengensis]|uniref:Hemolysin-type calcium-binding repeat-containing protein n=1 Tax=Maritimibacter dapengensis TaxID=2836868 RepID=A0ABS6SXP3_9RHOB|nr:calcium-binding protein [Maritimibacter dapengensis]MBV7377736.1 hypothetical protein [Maritimibacter dapengensis]